MPKFAHLMQELSDFGLPGDDPKKIDFQLSRLQNNLNTLYDQSPYEILQTKAHFKSIKESMSLILKYMEGGIDIGALEDRLQSKIDTTKDEGTKNKMKEAKKNLITRLKEYKEVFDTTIYKTLKEFEHYSITQNHLGGTNLFEVSDKKIIPFSLQKFEEYERALHINSYHGNSQVGPGEAIPLKNYIDFKKYIQKLDAVLSHITYSSDSLKLPYRRIQVQFPTT